MNRPWVWIGIVAVPVLGFLLLRSGSNTAAGAAPSPALQATGQGPTVIYSGSDNPGTVVTAPQASPVAPMAATSPDNLDPSMISAIRQNAGRKEIIFRDGSTMVVDDLTLQQLPEDVRFRVDYAREEK